MKRPIVDPSFTFLSQLHFFKKEIEQEEKEKPLEERIEDNYLAESESFRRLSLV